MYGIYQGQTFVALQIALQFVGPYNTYVLCAQVWTSQGEIASYGITVNLVPGQEEYLSMSYYGQDGYAAVGLSGQPAIYFPVTYDYGYCEYVIQTNGYFSDNKVNPSFAIEGTYTELLHSIIRVGMQCMLAGLQ